MKVRLLIELEYDADTMHTEEEKAGSSMRYSEIKRG